MCTLSHGMEWNGMERCGVGWVWCWAYVSESSLAEVFGVEYGSTLPYLPSPPLSLPSPHPPTHPFTNPLPPSSLAVHAGLRMPARQASLPGPNSLLDISFFLRGKMRRLSTYKSSDEGNPSVCNTLVCMRGTENTTPALFESMGLVVCLSVCLSIRPSLVSKLHTTYSVLYTPYSILPRERNEDACQGWLAGWLAGGSLCSGVG